MKALILQLHHRGRDMAVNKTNISQATIMAFIVLLGEVHTFWERSCIYGRWIIKYPFDVSMHIQHYIKDNGVMLNWILLSVFAYRLGKKPTRFSFWLLSMFIVWKCINIPVYWYNYRTFGYGWVYVVVIVIGFISYNWKKIKAALF